MMLFTPENARLILEGKKTQTRRLVRPDNEELMEWREPAVLQWQRAWKTRIKWQVGRTYAIQPGRGKPSIGRIRLLAIRQERLQEIHVEDMIAEGIPEEHDYDPDGNHILDGADMLSQWITLWNSINRKPGTRWEDDPLVWALTFEQRVGV